MLPRLDQSACSTAGGVSVRLPGAQGAVRGLAIIVIVYEYLLYTRGRKKAWLRREEGVAQCGSESCLVCESAVRDSAAAPDLTLERLRHGVRKCRSPISIFRVEPALLMRVASFLVS